MQKENIIIISVIILIVLLLWGWQSGFFVKLFSGNLPVSEKPTTMPEGIVLFYGQGCPHCKIVEDYISQNKIGEKIKITKLEVWYNKSNALLLLNTANVCKVDVSQGVPVPFLWDGSKCYIGDQDTINFLKNAAGIQ